MNIWQDLSKEPLCQLILPSLLPFYPKKFYMYLDNNLFLQPEHKDRLFKEYCRLRRRYMVVCRFIRKIRKPTNTMDLYLEPFTPSTWADISDRGILYRFRYVDLIRLIMDALTHTESWIHVPRKIHNPYTGLPFGIPALGLIYVSLHQSQHIVPHMFQQFMECMNLITFSIHNESFLRDYHIQRSIHELSNQEKYTYILEGFTHLTVYHTKTRQSVPILVLHPSLTVQQVVDTFEPMLLHYYRYLYAISTLQQEQSKRFIQKKLIAFKRKNPHFGKMCYGSLYSTVIFPWKELEIDDIKIPKSPAPQTASIYIHYH